MTPFLQDNVVFREVYCFLGGNEGNAGWCGGDGILPAGFEWAAYFAAGFVIMFILINAALLGAAAFVWSERRLLARFQARRGPNRWGPWGILQPFADLLKLIIKEDIIPNAADKLAFTLVPIIMLMALLLSLAVMPFARNTYLVNLNVGILYIIAVSSMSTIAIFMAGWSSANKYAMFGAMRGVAMLISYEIPLVLSLVGVVLIVGSMSLVSVVEAQTVPFLLVQPLGALVFMLGISAELNRTPFDILEAESEIVAGYHTEYSGIKFALIQAAEMAGSAGGVRIPGDDIHGRMVGAVLVQPAGCVLVPRQASGLRDALHLDSGDLPPTAHRPDNGLCLEVPAAAGSDKLPGDGGAGILLRVLSG